MNPFNSDSEYVLDIVPKQLEFGDRESLDPTNAVKEAMREALKNCRLSRLAVVSKMNAMAALEGLSCGGRAQKITPSLLDKWVAESATGHRIPLHYFLIFSKITNSSLPIQAMARPLGVTIISGADVKLLAWAKAEQEKRRLTKKVSQLAQEVGLK